MIDRERKIDIETLSPEQVDQLSVQIGAKVRGICDDAAGQINRILAVYGMSAKIAIEFDQKPNKLKDKITAPKKRGRKKDKNSNLKTEQL